MARSPLDGWRSRLAAAARFTLERGDAAAVALAGFLVRGGVVLLVLPIVVLPSPIALAATFGVDALTIAGKPTPWLVGVIALGVAAAITAVLVAGVGGALVDAWLVRAVVEAVPATGAVIPPPHYVLRSMAVRGVCLVPLAAAIAFAGSLVYDAAYRELTVPTDLATPLALRVAARTGPALAGVALMWLVEEAVAAIAVRRLLLAGSGIWRSLWAALSQIVRRPVSTAATAIVTVAVSAIAVGGPLFAASAAFDFSRAAARTAAPGPTGLPFGLGAESLLLALGAIAVACAVLLELLAGGLTASWRSAAFTFTTAQALAAERERVAARGAAVGPSMTPGTIADRR